jgi:hypothetical protein
LSAQWLDLEDRSQILRKRWKDQQGFYTSWVRALTRLWSVLRHFYKRSGMFLKFILLVDVLVQDLGVGLFVKIALTFPF